MRVVRTAQAEEDLVEIWLFIAKDSQPAADRVLESLESKASLLSQYPALGRFRPDIAQGLRYVPAGEYLILYRVTRDEVEVVRFVHGRRHLKRAVQE